MKIGLKRFTAKAQKRFTSIEEAMTKISNYAVRRTVFDAFTFCFLALVCLVVILQPTDEQVMNLSVTSWVFFGCLAGGAGLSALLSGFGVRTWGEIIFEPPHRKAARVDTGWYRTFHGWHMVITLLVTLVVAFVKTRFSLYELLNEDGFAGAVRLFKGIFNPNFDVLPRAILNIVETIFMAFLATALAIPVAFVLSFLAAKNIMQHPVAFGVYLFLRTALNVIRSIEALIWAIIFSVWVGIGPFAGMLALMIHSIASLAKQYSEMVEAVSEGPIEGVMSTGANKLQTIWFAIVPQVILPYISFTVYRWDINVRMATVIGLVGGGGIGTMLIQYQGQAMWPEVGCIILVIAVVVWLMDQASAYLREALK
ncbi:MAG: phosphonate ABC transporter, permease protein PhnE [Bdellovibrionaceae bacterium]|nr:phosphonate ABC transporter, permease protein PhnE [Pseudobdellovibrionaceae bacterium]